VRTVIFVAESIYPTLIWDSGTAKVDCPERVGTVTRGMLLRVR
jgi:hypothetical protein